jgi:hypothetical protein
MAVSGADGLAGEAREEDARACGRRGGGERPGWVRGPASHRFLAVNRRVAGGNEEGESRMTMKRVIVEGSYVLVHVPHRTRLWGRRERRPHK